ncbi:SagB family peptide dehydrogenase [Virgisporangium aurantiacum]|uniref:NADH oxidase n=1 Tax=Virgisporangium aurantiacum TaxID=175570 RepID=A0A8J3ZE20_9ACTN|nr:SagB family peptide dehydrogenase [Virgisporangium aurantiacum]GIJ62464.1 NADH oxidase [Virgisporangium aurantiacum]
MHNRETSVADRYWHDTFHDSTSLLAKGVGEEGAPDEPPKFKAYRGLARHRLPQWTPMRLGGVGAAFGPAVDGSPAPAGLTDEVLGALLYYGYGFSRVDVGAVGGWPYHRLVPSARCFYPTELYVWLPERDGIPGGVYHYDQLHHALVELRCGVDPDLPVAALDSALGSVEAVLLLTSHYWKTAFRYRHYAYRLCSQEAGMVAGNLLLVARSLGLSGHLHYQFLDDVLDRLLGVEQGQERTVAVVPVYRDTSDAPAGPRRDGRRTTSAELLDGLAEIRPRFIDVAKDLTLASSVYELDRHSVLDTTAEFASPCGDGNGATNGAVSVPAGSTRLDLANGSDRPVDLSTALRERHSGGTLFRPVRRTMPADDLARIVRYALAPYPSDLGPGPYSACYLVVQDVAGTPPGVYRCGPDGTLWRIPNTPPDPINELAMALGPPVTDYRNVNVVAYVVGDRSWATSRLGNRGYRILNQDAGLVAQRICVLSGAAGLAARPANGYAVGAIQSMLGIDDPGLLPMFQIAIGYRATTAQYEMPIVF